FAPPPTPPFAVQASEVSLGHDLQGFDVERLIGDDLLEPAVLIFELPQLHQVTHFQTAVLGAPVVERRFADAAFTADGGRLLAGLKLFENRDDLGFAESRLAHGGSFGDDASESTYPWGHRRGERQSVAR